MGNVIGISKLERAVMEMLLWGDHPVLQLLRLQFQRATLEQREFTGVGFFTHFAIPPDVPRVASPRSFELDDVHADIPGLEHGADFILFIRDGAIDFLEGFTYGDDRWPEQIGDYRLCYLKEEGTSVFPSNERDWDALRKEIGEVL
jgi:hypothetical protein